MIKVKYHDPELTKIRYNPKGDCYDLRCAEKCVFMKRGERRRISLGVSIEPPEGYRINLYPRSSTPQNFGIMLAHSVGVIDHTYSSNDDIIMFDALAIRDTIILFNERIAQFELVPIQPAHEIVEVDNLTNEKRGGYGSTGVR